MVLLIPQSWVAGVRRWARQSLPLMLWRLFLLVVVTGLFVASLLNGYVLVSTVLGIVFSTIWADDIKQTWRDLWNLQFWGVD